MIVPAFPSLPSGTMLSPLQTMSKLAGLGDDTVVSDTGGTIDTSVPDTFTSADLAALMGPAAGPNATGIAAGASTLNSYQDAEGNLIFPGQGMVTPQGTVSYFNAPANPTPGTAPTPQGLTSSQQAALANQLISGGFQLAKVATAQPGMSISPTGAITYQNPGFPIPGVSAAGSITTPSSSSMLAIAAIVGIGLFAFSRNK